jgi:hypothetical protein
MKSKCNNKFSSKIKVKNIPILFNKTSNTYKLSSSVLKHTIPMSIQINNNSPMYLPTSIYEKCLKIDDRNLTLYYNLLGVDDSIPSQIEIIIKKLIKN